MNFPKLSPLAPKQTGDLLSFTHLGHVEFTQFAKTVFCENNISAVKAMIMNLVNISQSKAFFLLQKGQFRKKTILILSHFFKRASNVFFIFGQKTVDSDFYFMGPESRLFCLSPA